jgi:hypothetical protein
VSALERSTERVVQLPWPQGHGEEHRSVGRTAQEGAEQLERRRVRPVQVVEYDHERLRGGERLQQLANRAVHPVAVSALRAVRSG